jgi:hypothetical protein
MLIYKIVWIYIHLMQWDRICHVLLNYHILVSNLLYGCQEHCMSWYYKPVYVQQPNKLLDNNDGQQWTLHEYDKLHIGPKTMVTLVYQMKTNQRPSLLATHLIVQC